jgi:hypothetical protein
MCGGVAEAGSTPKRVKDGLQMIRSRNDDSDVYNAKVEQQPKVV